jgi:hypothetical protein
VEVGWSFGVDFLVGHGFFIEGILLCEGFFETRVFDEGNWRCEGDFIARVFDDFNYAVGIMQ